MRTLAPGPLVIATHNPGKLPEIRALVEPYGMQVLSAGELGLPEPAETGITFAENALIKAHSAAQGSGYPALADDSGLEVFALGRRPGVYTADWALGDPKIDGLQSKFGPGFNGRNWGLAMQRVEQKLAELGPDADRTARFVCTLAIAWPDGAEAVFEGEVRGSLTWPPRGTLGFGYDPVFVPDGGTQTFAEIAPAAKHTISHRADAFAKLVATLF